MLTQGALFGASRTRFVVQIQRSKLLQRRPPSEARSEASLDDARGGRWQDCLRFGGHHRWDRPRAGRPQQNCCHPPNPRILPAPY